MNDNDNIVIQVQTSEADALSTGARSRVLISWGLSISVSIVLITLFFITHKKIEKLDKQVEISRQNLGQLSDEMNLVETELEELESMKRKSRVWQKQISQIYRQYRAIEDFAKTSSKLTIFYPASGDMMNDSLRLTVPDGKFKFLALFEKIGPSDSQTMPLAVRDTPGQKRVELTLRGPASYIVKMEHRADDDEQGFWSRKQLHLIVESSLQGFEPLNKMLFEPFPRPSGSSALGIGQQIVLLSNDVKAESSGFDMGSVFKAKSVKLSSGRWFVKDRKTKTKKFDLAYEMYLAKAGDDGDELQ